MQPGEEIESLVGELEQIVSEGKTPFTGGGQKKIVDAQDIYEILDSSRMPGASSRRRPRPSSAPSSRPTPSLRTPSSRP